jgi:hypothetical protein
MKNTEDRINEIMEQDALDESEENSIFDPDESEELEVLPDFDMEKLILDGKDAVLRREVEFFDLTDSKKKRMPVYVKPLSRGERGAIDKEIARKVKGKSSNKNVIDMICAFGFVMNEKGTPFNISVIREMPDGFVKNVSEEIKFISGDFKDRFEDKAIDKIFGKD